MENNEAASSGGTRAPLLDSFMENQRSGRGIYKTVVAAAANTLYPLNHDLGRVPTVLILVDAGDAAFPKYTWPLANRTARAVQISFDTPGTYRFWLS